MEERTKAAREACSLKPQGRPRQHGITMIRRRHVLRGGLVLTSSRMLSEILHFARNVIVARMLTPADFGVAATFWITTGFLATISALGFNQLLVHGNTTTTMAAAVAAYYCKVPVGHVGAGPRTHGKHSPFPEEINRWVANTAADLLFRPMSMQRAKVTHGLCEFTRYAS